MKANFVKQQSGILVPASDLDAGAISAILNGYEYEVDITVPVDPAFFRKFFGLMRFAFAHWRSDREFFDERGQFESFRKDLLIQAGYYNTFYRLDGSVNIEAKSLAWGRMESEELHTAYHAVRQTVIDTIFPDWDAQRLYREMAGFM